MLRLSPEAGTVIRTYEPDPGGLASGRVKLRVACRATGGFRLTLVTEGEPDDVATSSAGLQVCVDQAAARRLDDMMLDVRPHPAGPEFVFRPAAAANRRRPAELASAHA